MPEQKAEGLPTHEFEIHRNGEKFWTDAWIIKPGGPPPKSQAILIKHHWWVRHDGKLVRNEHARIFRWLRNPAERARLREKAEVVDTTD